MSNPFVTLAATDFLKPAQASLPGGAIWPRDSDAVLTAFLLAAQDSMAALHASVSLLSEQEAYPAESEQLLPDWETEFGLPDPCTPADPTTAQRQAALAAKILGAGGQSAAYFVSVAAALGFAVTITKFVPARAGQAVAGQPGYGPPWVFALQVTGSTDPELICRFNQICGARMTPFFVE